MVKFVSNNKTIKGLDPINEDFNRYPREYTNALGIDFSPDLLLKENLTKEHRTLLADANLRRICGFKKIPRESTLSRD